MLKTEVLGNGLKSLGFDVFSGVPCSYLKYLINYAINHCTYINAANEGDAIATCAGSALAGQKPVMLMQNSGLGNAISPLTSLIHTFNIPVLIFVSLRGEAGIPDEPQHELMGQITEKLLITMGIANAYLASNEEQAKVQLHEANAIIETGRPFCFIVKKNTFEPHALIQSQCPKPLNQKPLAVSDNETPLGTRTEALQTIRDIASSMALLATTGKTGRELFELGDAPNQFYQVGSMGCISAIALGLALAKPAIPVIAIDGDGAALMRLGSWAANGFYAPPNLCHVLLDNDVHDSTGGQDTLSKAVNFTATAQAMHYPQVQSVKSFEELTHAINTWNKDPKLSFIHVKIKPGSPKNLGRPNVSPQDVAQRFKTFVQESHD